MRHNVGPYALIKAIVLLTFVLLSVGCGADDFFVAFSWKSPDSSSEVRILRNLKWANHDYRFRVELSSHRGKTVLLESRSEAAIGLAEVSWLSDGRDIAMLVCDALMPPWQSALWIHYDVEAGMPRPTEDIKPLLIDQIRKRYSLPSREAVVEWACSYEGTRAFKRFQDLRQP